MNKDKVRKELQNIAKKCLYSKGELEYGFEVYKKAQVEVLKKFIKKWTKEFKKLSPPIDETQRRINMIWKTFIEDLENELKELEK